MTAILSEDGTTILLSRGGWSGSFPVSRLPSHLRFYRELRDRKGGKYAAYYQPTVAALEALSAAIIQGAVAGDDKPPAPSPPLAVSRPPRPAAHTAGHGESQFSLGL